MAWRAPISREMPLGAGAHREPDAARLRDPPSAAAVAEVPDWAELREAGAAIKDNVLAHLDRYLLQLEEQVTAGRHGALGR